MSDLLDAAISGRLRGLRVSLPGEVVSYDATAQEADVRPLLKDILTGEGGGEVIEDLPVIPHVPVAHPRGGGFHVSVPLAQGDPVLLVFCDWPVDDVRDGFGAASPSDRANHHLGNAVCYPGGPVPGGSELADPSGTDLVVGEDGGNRLRIAPGGPVRLGSQSGSEEFVALATKTLNELSSIVTGFNSHTHPDAMSGTGPPTTPLSSPSSVAASNVKAD